jgi:hypothetical protein
MTYVLLFLVNIVAGTINALAGGGGLITFPLLMLTVAPVTADATSAVALFFTYPTAVGVIVANWTEYLDMGGIRREFQLQPECPSKRCEPKEHRLVLAGAAWRKRTCCRTLPDRASMMSSRYINLGKAGVKLRTTKDSTLADS